MAYSLVTNTDGVFTTGSVNTTGCTLIILSTSSNGTTVSDNKGNTWTPLTSYLNFFNETRQYYCVNPNVGAGHTFSTALTYEYIAMSGWSGNDAVPHDQENGSAVSSQASPYQDGGVTPTTTDQLITTSLAQGDSGTMSVDSGFTITNQTASVSGVNYGGAQASIIETAIVAKNPTWSWTGGTAQAAIANETWIAAAVATNTSNFFPYIQ